MRRVLLRFLLVAAILVAAYFAWRSIAARKPVEVTTLAAELGAVESTATNSRAGTVKARRRAKMSPEIGGRCAELPFRAGDAVQAGDVLLRLDDQPLRARVHLAERDRATATAERERACLVAERAGREQNRVDRLTKDGIVSTDALDQMESQAATTAAACRVAEAGIERARAAIALAQSELALTVLRAPFSGVIADLSIEVGEWTTPSPPAMPVPAVIDLIDPSSIYISAPMDEVDSGRIRQGLPVRVSVDSHRGQSFPGRVTRMATYVLDREEQNRTVEIEVEIEDSAFARTLLPGTSADVEVILERREGVLRLPASTVLEGDRVLVVEGGLVAERKLTLGLRNWDFVQIESGLSSGERVITSLDQLEVKPGARAVEIPAATQPTEARP